jgi:hypothetical protein
MSSVPSSRYADWKAPDDDGQILIWPDASTLLRETRENQRKLAASDALIQNVALSELRKRQRQWIGHAADDQPLIATGHQTELYHPGVWVKDVLINTIAGRLGGQPWRFAVDTDAPKHLHLRWPGGSMPITDDDRLTSAAWAGLLESPSPAHVDQVESAIRDAGREWDFVPAIYDVLAQLRRLALEQPPLAASLTNAIHQLDWKLGLRHHALLMSPVWACEPYLVFAHHLLANAERFARQYNAALADYRREQGIHSPGRPMPDLQVGNDEVESPFWLDDLSNESRGRLMLRRDGARWAIPAPNGKDLFVLDDRAQGFAAANALLAFLRSHDLRIAPRALTLTMFFRLLLADQFVHGIGGGRYDQVTDRLIVSHFGIEPPRFSVTTATLYFPAARGQKRINLRPLLQEGRRLRHGSFSREKRALAERIATLPRRSKQRRELFFQMHARLAQHRADPALRTWSARLEEAMREQLSQKALFDRELFFAIQPDERLREMISRYDAAIASP